MLTFETAIGTCGLRHGPQGITHIYLPRDRALAHAAAPGWADAPAPISAAIAQIVALLHGERPDLRSVELDETNVAPFARRVYAAARALPPGTTASYGDIARAVGEPTAAQAVGAALGQNPFPIVVPCHRVLAADGSLNGFSAPGGVVTKRRMLEIEGAPGFTQQALFA